MNRRILFSVQLLFLVSCRTALIKENRSAYGDSELSQKAVFEYLKQPPQPPLLKDIENIGKGRDKIDPSLCVRPIIVTNGRTYFKDTMRSNLLIYPLPRNKYKLTIPDTLAHKYVYTDHNDQDYERDYGIIHQFSPLLPAKEKDIYLMEHYLWCNTCDTSVCVRWLNRDYLKFKVQDCAVHFIEHVHVSNRFDFIGFGGFERQTMENAASGEKIKRIGY
ncbi:MAG: hypothetical protein H6565_07425 [Lewinellaceae bacterium]|nr:hypothetical protein [Lewinellaceae bacterium]